MELNDSIGVTSEKISFPVACIRFFGKRERETTAEFAAELRALTDADKNDLCAMFRSVGYDITPAR